MTELSWLGMLVGLLLIPVTAYASGEYALKADVKEFGEKRALRKVHDIAYNSNLHPLYKLSLRWALHRYKNKHLI